MADRALRGVGLGAKSFEDEQGIEFAERSQVGFDCPNGHHFEVTFAIEAELPFEWECKKCGQLAKRSDGATGEAKETSLRVPTGTCYASGAASPSWRIS